MVLPALLLATSVALPRSPSVAHVRRHSPPATQVDRGRGHRHPVESGRPRQSAHVRHPRALHTSLRQVRESDWVLVVTPQHRRLLPALAPAQARILEPGLLLHVTGERVGPWIRVYDSSERSWVNVTNLAPATEPVGWAQTVLKIHPSLRPRVTVPPPLPVANTVPAASTGTVAATPQPVVVQQQVVVQPVVQQPAPVSGTDPASIEQEVIAAGDAAFGPGQGQYMANVVRYESGFNIYATNPSSGAAGLFQANPASKLGCYLSDVQCQLNWGIGYIRAVYGTPYNAWQSELTRGWY